jgi:uncharacterized protein (DUF2147 family)
MTLGAVIRAGGLCMAFALTGMSAWAQASPVGLWKTIDDETKQEKSLVRISETAGVLQGRVEKIADPAKQESVCELCEGALKNQKVLGMAILDGVKRAGSADVWEGGTILDPNNGKVYKVKLTPQEGGKRLEVRGYVGVPLLGRTQVWIRVE